MLLSRLFSSTPTRTQTSLSLGGKQLRCAVEAARQLLCLRLCVAWCLLLSISVSNSASAGADADSQPTAPTAEDLIESLGLSGHVEGGFYRRTYEATNHPRMGEGADERFSMTSIFYLLTAAGPVGHFHRNESDIVHYFHLGDPIDYFLIYPDGRLEQVTMGPDPRLGQRLQLTVPGGIWKASRLHGNGDIGYGLISEAVTPGFDYRDMTLGDTAALSAQFPDHAAIIQQLSRDALINEGSN